MIKKLLLVFASFFLLAPAAAVVPAVEISSPQAGQVLQGNVKINGAVSGQGFVSGEVFYAYAQSENATWFLIGSFTQPVANETMAVWDTSTISDGDYQIKVVVKYQNGDTKETILNPVLVRNYTVTQSTATPEGTTLVIESATLTQVASPVAAATPFPINPGASTIPEVESSLQIGISLGALGILFIGIYSFFRYLKFRR